MSILSIRQIYRDVKIVLKILEAQLLYNYIDVTDSLTHPLTVILTISSISLLFVDRFGHSLPFCFYDGFLALSRVFRGKVEL